VFLDVGFVMNDEVRLRETRLVDDHSDWPSGPTGGHDGGPAKSWGPLTD
jgi:hypothetical protein